MYAIVFFPKPPQKQIESFREKYDPKYNLIPAHITLVFPFDFSDEKLLVKHIEESVNNLKPFFVATSHSKKSNDNYLYILFKRGDVELMNLHDHLYSGILKPFLRNDIEYEPHLTIGYFETRKGYPQSDLYSKALTEIEQSPIYYEGYVDSVTLIEIKDTQNVRRFVKTINLF